MSSFQAGMFTTPSMNKFFDTKECDENTVDLEHLEKRKCTQEVLCKDDSIVLWVSITEFYLSSVERVTQNE